MDQLYDDVTKGRKRACKRSKKNKTEQEDITPKKRTRHRRDTMTQAEIEQVYIEQAQVTELTSGYSMSKTQTATEVTPSYSMQAPFQTMPRGPDVMQTSSTYSSQSRLPQSPSSTIMPGLNYTGEIPHNSSRSSTQQWLQMPSTSKTTERSTIGMSPNRASPGYYTQAQIPDIPSYHAMAERTRAATKMLQNRMEYSARGSTADASAYTTSEKAATGVNNPTGSSTQMQQAELSSSHTSRQTSAPRYNTRRGVHNLPISAAPTMNRYWIHNSTTITLTSKKSTQNINARGKNIKTQAVQTEINITPIEAKLLKLLQTKQLKPENFSVSIDGNDYTVTYKQVQERKSNTASIHSIVRSSDIIKSSLINFYNNALTQNNVPEILNTNIHPSQNQQIPNNNENNYEDISPPSPMNSSKNDQHEVVTENPQLLQALLSHQRTNDERNSATTYTHPEINQPRMNSPQKQRFHVHTGERNQYFANNNNQKYNYFGPRGPQSWSRQRPDYPRDFLRFAPFMNPRFLPTVVRQTFEHFGMPGWF